MGCRDWEGVNESDAERVLRGDLRIKEARLAEMQTRLDKLTRMLCATLTQFDGVSIPLDPETLAWWDEHKAADRRAQLRAEAEAVKLAVRAASEARQAETRCTQGALRVAALVNLTPAEVDALVDAPASFWGPVMQAEIRRQRDALRDAELAKPISDEGPI